MSVLTIFLVLICAGIILWLVNKYVPMDSKIKFILNTVVVSILVIWLLKAFGVFAALKEAKI